MKNIFWIHGGPGYNAKPEAELLNNSLKSFGLKTYFWNHPSEQRGDITNNTWDEYIFHLEESFLLHTKENGPCFIVAHSFGARSSLPLIHKYEHLIQGVVWISSGTSMLETFKNIFRFISEDYLERGILEKGALLKGALEIHSMKAKDCLSYLPVVAENENFIQYYWTNKEKIGSYYGCFVDEWAIDMTCFSGVVSTMPDHIEEVETTLPTLILCGENEVVVNNDYEIGVARRVFKNCRVHLLENSSHFLHIEEEEKFTQLLAEFVDNVLSESSQGVFL